MLSRLEIKRAIDYFKIIISDTTNVLFSNFILKLDLDLYFSLVIKFRVKSLKVPKFVHLSNYNSMQAFKFYESKRRYFDKLVEISFRPLARDGGSESGFSLSSTIVGFILEKDGIHKARDIYNRYVLCKWNQ